MDWTALLFLGILSGIMSSIWYFAWSYGRATAEAERLARQRAELLDEVARRIRLEELREDLASDIDWFAHLERIDGMRRTPEGGAPGGPELPRPEAGEGGRD